MIEKSEQIDALATALGAVQAEIKVAIKDKINPGYRSKYADLQTVWDTARHLLAKYGLAVVQLPGGDGDVVRVTTMVMHRSGQWLADNGLAMVPAKKDPQGIASAITYARRYGLSTVIGIVSDEDDDGEAASHPAKPAVKVRELADEKTFRPKPAAPPPAATSKAPPAEIEAESPVAIALLAALSLIKAQGGWNAKAHKDAWKTKHETEIESLSTEDKLEVSKLYIAVPFKTAKGS